MIDETSIKRDDFRVLEEETSFAEMVRRTVANGYTRKEGNGWPRVN